MKQLMISSIDLERGAVLTVQNLVPMLFMYEYPAWLDKLAVGS